MNPAGAAGIPPEVSAAVAWFPPSFGLKGYPGETFALSLYASYVEPGGAVVLYVERLVAGRSWQLFAKGSPEELAEEICDRPPAPLRPSNRSAGALRGYLRSKHVSST